MSWRHFSPGHVQEILAKLLEGDKLSEAGKNG